MTHKIISFISIFSATFILLSHEIIPHHDHNQYEVCHSHQDCLPHNHEAHFPQGQDQQTPDCCYLADNLFIFHKNDLIELPYWETGPSSALFSEKLNSDDHTTAISPFWFLLSELYLTDSVHYDLRNPYNYSSLRAPPAILS